MNDDCKASKVEFVLEADDDAVVTPPEGKTDALVIQTENEPIDASNQPIQSP